MTNSIFDISHFQGGKLDFAAAKAAGMVGVIHKATEGVAYMDPTWGAHRAAAKAAGLLFGSYHFGTVAATGAKQAVFFLSQVGPRAGELLVLDFERSGSPMPLEWAADFVTAIKSAVGVYPVLYAGGYLKGLLQGGKKPGAALLACPLWLAEYSPVPALPSGWAAWKLWQYTNKGDVPGIGVCDRSRFNGTEDELRAFWAAF